MYQIDDPILVSSLQYKIIFLKNFLQISFNF